MKHVLKILLVGGLADDYLQPLSKVRVCLHNYSSRKSVNQCAQSHVTGHAASIKELDMRNKSLLAEGMTDTNGKIDLLLDKMYAGGAIDAGILLKKPFLEQNHYVHLKTIRPFWHMHGNVFIGAWNYCLLPREAKQNTISPLTDQPTGLPFSNAGKQIRTSVPAPGVE